MQLLVVPRSIPIVFPMCVLLLCVRKNLSENVADLRSGFAVGRALGGGGGHVAAAWPATPERPSPHWGAFGAARRPLPADEHAAARGADGTAPQRPAPSRLVERSALGHIRRSAQPAAVRPPRVTRAPPVPEQVQVQLELLAGRGDLEHRVVELLERGAGAEQREAACRRARRGCRPARRASRARTAARTRRSCGRRPAARSGSAARPGPSSSGSQSSDSSPPGAVSVIARRIDLIRADLTFEMPPGRIASSISSTGASRTATQVGKRSRSAR